MKQILPRLWREPLVQFVLIGVGLFLLFGLVSDRKTDASKRIVVTTNQIEQLVVQFSGARMRPPTESEQSGLIDNFVRGEVYYREAMTMGLDQSDMVIRQRMRQKLELLMDDVSAARVPTNRELSLFLQENPDKYRLEPQVSFRQVYLNMDRRLNLDEDAAKILADLRGGAEPGTLGDRIMLGYEFGLETQSQIARSFGDKFAEEIVEIEPGDWTGPLYSGLGGHIVQVTDRVDGRMPELTEVRGILERDWVSLRQREFKDAAYSRLLEGYEVLIEGPEDGE